MYSFIGNLTIYVKSRAFPVSNVSKEESIAIEMLREMITEAEYRKYIKDGFICVKGVSGKIYQVFRHNNHVRVWHNGKLIEEICSYISDTSVPPTDKVVAFKTIIETDEEEFRSLGNVYKMRSMAA